MKLQRISALLLSVFMCISMTACRHAGGDENLPALTVWVLSEDYKTNIERATSSAFTSIDWKIQVDVIENDMLNKLLDGELAGLSSVPDVFMLAPEHLAAFRDSDVTADLGSFGITFDENRYYRYTVSAGTNSDGILKAACYEADPGLFFYRRSIADFYLGTDDPASIQDMISDWDGFYQTAKKLSEASNGDTYMVAGVEELMSAYLADVPLVQENRLHINEQAQDFIDYCRAMASEGLIYDAQRWSEAWIEGISDPQTIFGYFSSGIGMESVLKPCCGGTISGEGSYGDWAAVPGPASFNWGGCWLAMRNNSPMADEAALLIEYFTCEEAAMRTDCLISGAFSANRTVVEQIRFDSQFSESFLSAQNCYSQMAEAADDITMDNMTPYDTTVNRIFSQCVSDYAFDRRSLEDALSDFEKTVMAAYPHLVE